MPGFAMSGVFGARAVWRVCGVVFAMVALAVVAGSGAVSAQDAATPEPGVEQLKVGALLCEDWSCLEFGDRLDGFTIYAVDLDSGEVLDWCVTDLASEFEGCWLEVPSGARWTLDFDDAQTPEGYIYHGSIIGVEGGAHGSITYVPFHPLEDPEPGNVTVQAALCTDATCDEFAEIIDGFLISAVNPETGQVYDECLTGNVEQGLDKQCILDVPVKGVWELRWPEEQDPEGYEPFGEPIEVGDPVVLTVGFVPEDEATAVATEKPVTSLPVTGAAGTAAEDEGPVALIVTAMVLLGLGGGAMALDARRRRP